MYGHFTKSIRIFNKCKKYFCFYILHALFQEQIFRKKMFKFRNDPIH